jgi:predicted nucleic acid-binding protein
VRRETIGVLINLLREEAELVAARVMKISPDPADDPFCACAEQGAADFLVTLNPRDFPQEALSVKVLAPGDTLPSGQAARRK